MENPIAVNIVEQVNTLDQIIQMQSRDIEKMKSEGLALTLKCSTLEDENMNFKEKDGGLLQRVSIVEADNISLKEEVSCLKAGNISLKEEVSCLRAENISLKEQVSCLKAENISLNKKVETMEVNTQRVIDFFALLSREYLVLKNKMGSLPYERESSTGDKLDDLPLTVSNNTENLPSTVSDNADNSPATASNYPENLPGATPTESKDTPELQSLADKFACLPADRLAAEMWNSTMQELGTMNGQELVEFVRTNSEKFKDYITTVSGKSNFFDAMKNTCEQSKLSKGVLKKIKRFFEP